MTSIIQDGWIFSSLRDSWHDIFYEDLCSMQFVIKINIL